MLAVGLSDGFWARAFGFLAVLLASVLERFFAKYVGINGFTETALRCTDRGEVMRWPLRLGSRAVL